MSVVLFDLDGTLVETAQDLGAALNIQLVRHGKKPLAQETIRPIASHGSRGLLELGFGLSVSDANFIKMRDEYLAIYDEVLTHSPALFVGMDDVLNIFESKGIPWGIVTNKPRRFTTPIMQVMGLDKRAGCVICGDDAAQPKPHPATLLMACDALRVAAKDCIYIGDAARDIEAGIAAGMKTAVAVYGYLSEADKPAEWGADYLITAPKEILNLI